MAANQVRYVGNIFGAPGPWKFPGKFQAGTTQAIKRGEIIKLSGGNWVPEALDEAMAAIIAISDCEIKTGDLAGYHDIIVPRPGDIFEVVNNAADNPSPGASLYSALDSQKLTTAAGTNVMANVVDETMTPKQGFQSVNPSFDATVTIPSRGNVRCMFKASVSYYAALQK